MAKALIHKFEMTCYTGGNLPFSNFKSEQVTSNHLIKVLHAGWNFILVIKNISCIEKGKNTICTYSLWFTSKSKAKKKTRNRKVQRNKVKETQTIRCGKNNNKMDGLCVQKKVASFCRFLLHTGPWGTCLSYK